MNDRSGKLLNNHDFFFQKRNKPKEPPKAPKAAPFFLPTTQELVPKFLQTEEDQADDTVSYPRQ